VGQDLTEGVLNLLCQLGILAEEALPFHWAGLQRPLQVTDEQVVRVRASRGGLFMPTGTIWSSIEEGASLGQVVDPVSAKVLEEVLSPVAGRLLAVRERPVVFPGTMVARVVAE
jgi:predicted deacylase